MLQYCILDIENGCYVEIVSSYGGGIARFDTYLGAIGYLSAIIIGPYGEMNKRIARRIK